jgi:hypothetical protein
VSQDKPPHDVTGSRLGGRTRPVHGSRRSAATLLAAAFASLATLVAGSAQAQQRTFYLDRIQVSGAPDDGLAVWRAYLAEKTRFYGAATLGYTLNPLRKESLTDNPNVVNQLENPVSNQLVMHLAVGAEFAGRFGVNLSLPIIMYEGGGADPLAHNVGNGLGRGPAALEDLRFNGKV